MQHLLSTAAVSRQRLVNRKFVKSTTENSDLQPEDKEILLRDRGTIPRGDYDNVSDADMEGAQISAGSAYSIAKLP